MRFSNCLFYLALAIGALTVTGNSTLSAQPTVGKAQNGLAVIFPLEDEVTFDKLSLEFSGSLLTACNNDMAKAYEMWLHLLNGMESYAESVNFDLNGVKLIMRVYWNTDGRVQHIGYYLRPESLNVDKKLLEKHFGDFVKTYKSPMTTTFKYSHYTGVRFPINAVEGGTTNN